MTNLRFDVPTLTRELRAAMRHGARAASLAEHAPGLVDLLTAGHGGTGDERALIAEQIIREATAPLGDTVGPAMRIMLGLEPGTWHTRIETRRERAADMLDIGAGTFRRPHREGTYLRDIAWEIWRTHRRAA
ncbi:conserved hypothetical protein [Frankia canadensis]|uniref:Uncharacterized protein n=1 Tax=Frankia canadensis TaxID=1836972 RepID=A0A2I2KR21_9ACTN|nr:hypothetical protein [Frankia canadensis]SNQ48121.1 conserved hypothetical protein [Frankia canadensis]SOU55411.1 conserved hypothetical protein [Frankia canadensis]